MVVSLPPPLQTQPEREGLQGGMYHDPACSLKLNTEIIVKTHPGAFPQTRTTCIQRGTSGNAVTTLGLKEKDKINTTFKKNKKTAVLMAHDQSIVQALSIFHLQEGTKKRNKDTTIHWGKMV